MTSFESDTYQAIWKEFVCGSCFLVKTVYVGVPGAYVLNERIAFQGQIKGPRTSSQSPATTLNEKRPLSALEQCNRRPHFQISIMARYCMS